MKSILSCVADDEDVAGADEAAELDVELEEPLEHAASDMAITDAATANAGSRLFLSTRTSWWRSSCRTLGSILNKRNVVPAKLRVNTLTTLPERSAWLPRSRDDNQATASWCG
jgi:hypothetical protein